MSNFDFGFIEEPKLYFAGGNSSVSPRAGLVKFGPIGTENIQVREINVGLIGSREDIKYTLKFFEFISDPITQGFVENTLLINFPGLGKFSPLKFELKFSSNNNVEISKSEINSIKADTNRINKVTRFFELIKQKITQLVTISTPKVDIICIVPPQSLIDETKNPDFEIERIKTLSRTFGLDYSLDIPELFDFHHALKAFSMSIGLTTQIILPRTIHFKRGTQDIPTIAWNISVGIYYKATDTPWKLANIDDRTCYVGLSFYQEITDEYRGMRTAMAQVFLRSGESQIIRGKPFQWDPNVSKHPELTDDQSHEILSDALKLYENVAGKPDRVVIHKSTPFSESEINGFDAIVNNLDNGGDYLHVKGKSFRRILPNTQYPTIRGSYFTKGNSKIRDLILYTTGFVPSLNTYMGSRIPSPLILRAFRQDSETRMLLEELLSLTKLDWNNTNFNNRHPVTIGVSKKVGSVLGEVRQFTKNPRESYRFYM